MKLHSCVKKNPSITHICNKNYKEIDLFKLKLKEASQKEKERRSESYLGKRVWNMIFIVDDEAKLYSQVLRV